MTTKTTAELAAAPTYDRFGIECLGVELSGSDAKGRFALVDADGLEKLRRAGARALYLLNDGQGREYVSFVAFRSRRGERRVMTAARAIMGDPEARRIEYVSGDRLDLRRRNLRAREYGRVGVSRAAQR